MTLSSLVRTQTNFLMCHKCEYRSTTFSSLQHYDSSILCMLTAATSSETMDKGYASDHPSRLPGAAKKPMRSSRNAVIGLGCVLGKAPIAAFEDVILFATADNPQLPVLTSGSVKP
jgi:hypothetical protein